MCDDDWDDDKWDDIELPPVKFRWPMLVHALLEIPRAIGQGIADCFENLQDAVGAHGNYQMERVETAKGLSKELDQILKGET